MTTLAVDTMQGLSKCVHSNSFPWYPLISQKFLCKLAKLNKNWKNDVESGCGWLYKVPRSPKNKKNNYVLKTKTILGRGVQPFCYCRPHYFYLYEVRPPMSSSYIYEIR